MVQSSQTQFLVRSLAQLRTTKVRMDHIMNSTMGDVNHEPLSICHVPITVKIKTNLQSRRSSGHSLNGECVDATLVE